MEERECKGVREKRVYHCVLFEHTICFDILFYQYNLREHIQNNISIIKPSNK